MTEYKVGDFVWTNFYFSDLNTGYSGKSCAFSSKIIHRKKLIGNAKSAYGKFEYLLSDQNQCFIQHICNFGDPVYEV